MGSVKVALVLAAVAALALAGSAAAIRLDGSYGPSFVGTIETDGLPPTETTDTTPTTPDVCPATAVSQDPNPLCPGEPSVSDDEGNPVPCNYYSGVPSEPCPHADADYWIVRCDSDGSIALILRDATDAEADEACPGAYTVLDR